MQIELELLAPAKNRDIGIAAIDCGADAVYIAGPQFGAREGAGNPISEIAELVAYAHKFGVKVFMTVNTILYDNELAEAEKIIKEAYQAGVDAIIVQDLGVLKLDLPPVPLHASTQTNLRSPEQAQFLKSLGFERLILARELSLNQISAIKKATDTDIETFVHGALCVSYSGQCYLSHKLTGRSANRGSCAQACRSLYTLTDSSGKIILKDTPILSLKDFNLSNRIPELVEAGVTSFKIEGRLKNISYIKNIVKLYRQKIDEFLSNNPQYKRASLGEVNGGFNPDADLTFNRGYTEFFIDSQRGRWRSTDGAKYLGEYIGTVTRCSKERNGNLQFEYRLADTSVQPISNGDGLCFVSQSGEISGVRANSCNGLRVSTTEKLIIQERSKLFRNYNILFERELERNMPKRLIPVSLHLKNCNDDIVITAEWGKGNDVQRDCVTMRLGEALEVASNRDLAVKNLHSQLGKSSGIFKFSLEKIDEDVTIPFLPIGKINELRRELAQMVADKIEQATLIERQYRQEHTIELRKRAEESAYIKTPLGTTPDYRANCSNKLSGRVYESRGAERVLPAFELKEESNAELMRSKYCIKYELGLCPNYKITAANDKGYVNRIGKTGIKEPLILLNGKNRLQLKFDCSICEMVVIG
ncbi:MAG: U32 family peptidase [Bacteroidales bacterium]|nr:U32 family peptidase [Bacteroidales bacterium]